MRPALTSDNLPLSEPKMATEMLPREGSESLPGAVLDYVREAVAPNTRRAYRADLDHFLAWGGTIPATDVMVAEYLSVHAGQLAVSTLARRLAAISKGHAARGLPSPTCSSLIKSTLSGIKRTHGSSQRVAKPLLVEDLLRIMPTLGDGPKDLRDRALLLVGFAGGFRRSELVEIECGDLEWVRQGVVVHLRRSKTDQEGVGRKVGIPNARGRWCPVEAVTAWLNVAGIEGGPVFRPVDRHGTRR